MPGQCFLYRLRVVVSPFPMFPCSGTCERLSRSLSTMNSSDSLWSSAHYLFFALAYLAAFGSGFGLLPFPGFPFRGSLSVCHPMLKEHTGYPKFSDVSLHTYRALYSDRPSETLPLFFFGLFVLASGIDTPSSSALISLRSCCGLRRMRFRLQSM